MRSLRRRSTRTRGTAHADAVRDAVQLAGPTRAPLGCPRQTQSVGSRHRPDHLAGPLGCGAPESGRSVSLRVVIAEIVLERLNHHAELRVGRRMMPPWFSPWAIIVLAAFGLVVVGILLRSCD
jgi:hypothetical protein